MKCEIICAYNMREYPVCDICPNLRRLRPRRTVYISKWKYEAKYKEHKKFKPDEPQTS